VTYFLAEHPYPRVTRVYKNLQMRSLKSTWPKHLLKSKSSNYSSTAHQGGVPLETL